MQTELVRLGREYQRLVEEFWHLDEGWVGRHGTARGKQMDRMADAVRHRQEALADYASHLPAQSLQDAMFQVCLVNTEVCALSDDLQPDPDEQTRRAGNATRMLYSIGRLLERITGCSLKEFGGGYAMDDALDPFRNVTQPVTPGEDVATERAA